MLGPGAVSITAPIRHRLLTVVFLGVIGVEPKLSVELNLVGVKVGAILFSTRTPLAFTNLSEWVGIISPQILSVAAKIGAPTVAETVAYAVEGQRNAAKGHTKTRR